MELGIFTCECMLDHLIMMRNESLNKIVTKIFSITGRSNIKCITRLHSANNIFFFCLRCLNIIRPFLHESVLCEKRYGFGNYTCLELHNTGFENNCRNCDSLLKFDLEKYLIKVKNEKSLYLRMLTK